MLLLPACVDETAMQETETETTTTETTTEAVQDTESVQPEYSPGEDNWDVPVNANELLAPSQEELDEMMMEDAWDAMQYYDGYGDGYYDYDSSLGKRGR